MYSITYFWGKVSQNQMRYHHILVRMSHIKNTEKKKCWQVCGNKRSPLTPLVRIQTIPTIMASCVENLQALY